VQVSLILDRLIDALDSPSVPVQNAVASCLQPLISSASERAQDLIDTLFDRMINSKKPSERRGAAAGLGGIVRGCVVLLT
jgi:hypothetical protein